MPTPRPVIAILNTAPDTVELLRIFFEQSGFVAVNAFTFDIREGRTNLRAFVDEHKPDVVLYDIAPPYDRNFALFRHLRETGALKDLPVVLTSTNVRAVRSFVADPPEIHEVIGKPYDLNELLKAVRKAMVVTGEP
jgi:DNA-binding response OmpR family regulator